jgi:MFS family permease
VPRSLYRGAEQNCREFHRCLIARRQNRSSSFFLVLPYGISSGFISITLPFVLTRAGFSVATAASIVAIGVSANLWRFLWGPVADLTLTARRWYLIGLSAAALTLFLLGLFPLNTNTTAMLMAIVFVSQVASTFMVLPVGGLMAHTVAEEAKGRAAGWYKAGNLGGTGIGGGAGVWLASHYSKEIAGEFLSLAMLAAALALFFVSDVRLVTTETIRQRLRLLGRDIFSMLHSPILLFTIVLVMSPIGASAMNNVWSAVALTGAPTQTPSPSVMALVAIVMAAAPRTPTTYSSGVLAYAFFGAPLTLPFRQWFYLRLDAVPRRRNTQRFLRSATCRSFT